MAAPDDQIRSVFDSHANRTATVAGNFTAAAVPLTASERYTLGDEIAQGGMGVVYRAIDTVLGREIAVKVLKDKYSPDSGVALRFADEARITSQLQHPSIPPVHDLGTLADGRPFLAMKLIKGLTLEEMLKDRNDPEADRGRLIAAFEKICQALAYAHSRNVIHRDLKPANVMVGNYGEVQVMDWGLAKVLGSRVAKGDDPEATSSPTQVGSLRDTDGWYTQAGSVLGTPAFMPPEQAIGAVGEIDARSDVFGLGAILAVILTGKPPFTAATAETARVMAARADMEECFTRLDTCGADPDLVTLCKRCLAPKPADRPADAGAVAKAVAELRAAADERARHAELQRVRAEGEKATAEAKAAERRKRRTLWIGAAGVLVVTVIGGLAAFLTVQRQANADLTAKNTELADEQAKVEKRFELAQKAITRLHSGVSEDLLLKSDQFKELRNQLLKEAADFYGDLEKLLEGQADPKSRRLLAEGYFQLAELTGNIGSKTEALAVHHKALVVRRELAAAAGADVETRLDVARSFDAVGNLLLDTDAEGALRAFKQQHDVAAELTAAHPTKAVQAVLGRSFLNTGRVLIRMGKTAEALRNEEKAVDILRELAAANPDATELQFDLASSLLYKGAYLWWEMGKWEEVFGAYKNAGDILQKLAEANPAVTRFWDKLLIIHNNTGATLYQLGKPAEGLEYHEKSFVISKRLVATHPAVTEFQVNLIFNYYGFGDSLSEIGKLAESKAAYEKGLEIAWTVAEANPTDLQIKWLLAEGHNRIGEVYKQMGNAVDALRYHENARDLLIEPAAKSANPLLHFELATSYDKIGLLLSASGKPKEALESCKNALDVRRKQSDAQPTARSLREDLAGTLSVLGTVQRRAGQPTESVESFRHAITLLEQLPPLSPRNRYKLACWHAQLAGLAAEPGSGMTADQGVAEAERAMAALRQALDTGFGAIARLRSDAALETLRLSEDFQKLLKELEEKHGPKDEQ